MLNNLFYLLCNISVLNILMALYQSLKVDNYENDVRVIYPVMTVQQAAPAAFHSTVMVLLLLLLIYCMVLLPMYVGFSVWSSFCTALHSVLF